MYVAKVDRDVASVSEAYCRCLFKMFHLFQTYVASVFDLNVAHVFTPMLLVYVRNVIAISVSCWNKCFHVAILQVFLSGRCICVRIDVAIVCSKCFIYFRRMLQPSVSCFRDRESWGARPGRRGMGRGESWAGGRGAQRT
jgi:hypothetical protein